MRRSQTQFDDRPDAAPAKVAVFATEPVDEVQRRAEQLAAQLNLPLVAAYDSAFDMLLTVTNDRLELRFPQSGGPRPLYVDFVEGRHGYARGVHRYGLLFNAIGYRNRPLTVLDATAGLGRAAFRLAYHGCHVSAVERSAILFELLKDGIDRAARVPHIRDHMGDRLQVHLGDSREFLHRLAPDAAPDVVYLDPMFPPTKKSALVKVEMRILRRLVGDDLDADSLFEAARSVARQRVVVKRFSRSEPLSPDLSHSHSDGTTRYDVYMQPARTREDMPAT
ncbi:MAG: class I SAM-dependent methyltransferase [Phycisphaerales bacterium]|nr:class I SAM-dependent methyltransferase [Phycisphaerales bacterium]MCB9854718.1 class I SAM-dependent methyltransferase [Phycisphaerales bacterium]